MVAGYKYDFYFLYSSPWGEAYIFDRRTISYGGFVKEEEPEEDNPWGEMFENLGGILESSSQQSQQQHEEAQETRKGILATIKEVVSFLNPLSENFFVYKLIDLLLDLLIKVFVPSTEFFGNWFADLNDYFGDRFGMLYYPFELIIDILSRVSKLSNNLNGNFILKTPDLNILGSTLIPAYEFNFNTFLENDTFKTVYNVYLTSVDVILICCLVVLCKNTFVEIFGGRFIDDVVDTVQSDETSYKRYVRGRENRKRYLRGGKK